MRIFIAGASGVIGQQLIPLLVNGGHEVTGMTRSESKTGTIKSLGASPVVCDVYDTVKLKGVIVGLKPDMIISQLTNLPDDPSLIPEMGSANSHIRREGTRNLLAVAANLSGARFICQSVAWQIPGKGGEAVTEMERMVLAASGIVLRYGQFYGPHTYYESEKPPEPRIKIKEAARITLESLSAASGIYNIEDSSDTLRPLNS